MCTDAFKLVNASSLYESQVATDQGRNIGLLTAVTVVRSFRIIADEAHSFYSFICLQAW